MDVQQSILEELEQLCSTCDSQISYIQDGEFTCPNGDDSANVLYRAVLFGKQPNDCDELVATVTNWVETAEASLHVQSSLLQVADNCMVRIDSFGSDLNCFVPTTEVGGLGTEANTGSGSVTAIGAAAGIAGGLILVTVLVIIVAIVIIAKKKKQKRFDNLKVNHYNSAMVLAFESYSYNNIANNIIFK